MPKAVLSNRIYMDAEPQLLLEIEEELTYMFPRHGNAPPEVVKNMAVIRNGLISFPVGRTDLIPDHYEIVDKRIVNPLNFPEFGGTLRESQQEIYDNIGDGGIINAAPAFGKTFCGLAIAEKLAQKTLIVTHTVPLRNQWAREVKKWYGFEPGLIGGGEFNINSPITVGNIQSLYRKIPEVKKEFGTLILDEMHHVSARTFSKVIDTNYARHKIGLSATIERKDGKHVMFRDYFGNNVLKAKRENSMTPDIHIVRTPIRFMDGSRTPWARRINHLCEDPDYRELVATLAATYAALGHKVLVVASRVYFLEVVANMIGDNALLIIGKTDDREEEIAKIEDSRYNVICGTQSIFSEGINQTNLSCLILANPINNDPLLEQLIGRIERVREGKKQPIVVDIHMQGNTARRQASGRMNYYMKKGYKIKQVA